MSENAAEQYCLFSRASFILRTIRCVCSIVEFLCLNLDWWLNIKLLFKILDRMGKGLIGRYDVNSLRGYPGFRMRMICANFHSAEKYPLSKTALNNCVGYFIPMLGDSLTILQVIFYWNAKNRLLVFSWYGPHRKYSSLNPSVAVTMEICLLCSCPYANNAVLLIVQRLLSSNGYTSQYFLLST
jgi:hypothetical protein